MSILLGDKAEAFAIQAVIEYITVDNGQSTIEECTHLSIACGGVYPLSKGFIAFNNYAFNILIEEFKSLDKALSFAKER